MKKSARSFYEEVGQSFKDQDLDPGRLPSLNLAKTIRDLRTQKGLSGADLCRKVGSLDPRTLTAVEKGRIKNPSLDTLKLIAAGLNVTVSDLFRSAELELSSHYYVGTQKGAYTVEFQRSGFKMVSFTPLNQAFFCGKLIIEPRRKIEGDFFQHPYPIYISILMGRFDIQVAEKKASLKEGENLYFHGAFRYSIQNISQREGAILLMTSPGILGVKGA